MLPGILHVEPIGKQFQVLHNFILFEWLHHFIWFPYNLSNRLGSIGTMKLR
jgi:hypothetical protein